MVSFKYSLFNCNNDIQSKRLMLLACGLRYNSESTSLVAPGYFEKLKYYPAIKQVSPDHSFLWQKWVQQLSEQTKYYTQLQKDMLGMLSEHYPHLVVDAVDTLSVQKSTYYKLDSTSVVRRGPRRRVNFYTYRKLRFNQLRLFYTTCNQRQFKSMYSNYNYIKKRVLDHFLLSLEGRLEFFLFRVNFFPSKYFIRQFLHHHGVLVNGYLTHDKNYILKPWDRVSIPKAQHARIFNLLKERTVVLRNSKLPVLTNIKSKKSFFRKFSSLNLSPLFALNFITNYPRYIEVDYTLLEALFIRNPSLQDVILPLNSEIDSSNRSFYKW